MNPLDTHSSLQLLWPLALVLLPLPLLARYLLPPAKTGAALKIPFFDEIAPYTASVATQGRRGLRLLAWLAWILLVIAAARPQWVGEPVQLPVKGRDLMLAVDLSGSMQFEDFVLNGRRVNRLTAIKAVASDFIERRKGDRIGLILFGSQAYLQTPLTFDRATVERLLQEAQIGLAGKETAIGDAIGLAVKRLATEPEGQKVLILLTDGANTAGSIDPVKAAELAKKTGLKIYTIGVGSVRRRQSPFGFGFGNPGTDLDEPTLRKIAKVTGGRYFRARNTQELQQIYDELDALEAVGKDNKSLRPVKSLYVWPLSLSLLLALLIAVMRRR